MRIEIANNIYLCRTSAEIQREKGARVSSGRIRISNLNNKKTTKDFFLFQ